MSPKIALVNEDVAKSTMVMPEMKMMKRFLRLKVLFSRLYTMEGMEEMSSGRKMTSISTQATSVCSTQKGSATSIQRPNDTLMPVCWHTKDKIT